MKWNKKETKRVNKERSEAKLTEKETKTGWVKKEINRNKKETK